MRGIIKCDVNSGRKVHHAGIPFLAVPANIYFSHAFTRALVVCPSYFKSLNMVVFWFQPLLIDAPLHDAK